MGLDRYRSARIRFTWQNRRVSNISPRTSQKVLADCKDQRGVGGKCTYVSTCTALEAHKRLKTNLPCAELSWTDLKSKADNVVPTMKGRMSKCLTAAQREGVCYESSQGEPVKIENFEKINTRSPREISNAIKRYLKKGPMLGTFEVYGTESDQYGASRDVDAIYFVNQKLGISRFEHSVTITGIGVQGMCPFWEFQNQYGPRWRGAARGFGQICAVHLISLYGFTLV